MTVTAAIGAAQRAFDSSGAPRFVLTVGGTGRIEAFLAKQTSVVRRTSLQLVLGRGFSLDEAVEATAVDLVKVALLDV